MSSSDYAVTISGLGKRYVVPQSKGDGRNDKLHAHLRSFLPFLRDDERDYFWALRDFSLDVKKGEILGILGKNGSGKSTLLKILSRITLPTRGSVIQRGRVGSLLEVGTGFHPDLTGRENVYMSGVLLGLSKSYIASRFDELVDFSGIEKFIDVPVKRYSSGMYVRLAYAVASFLQSDILILDEVLAVGDLAFREKSQKNIEKIAKDGRTVLFVSHDIQAVRDICQTGVLLENGRLTEHGAIEDVTSTYMRKLHGIGELSQDIAQKPARVCLESSEGWDGERKQTVIKSVETCDVAGEPTRVFKTGDTVKIRIAYSLADPLSDYYFSIFFVDEYGGRVQVLYSLHDVESDMPNAIEGVVECQIDDLRLVTGVYSLMLDFGRTFNGRMQFLDCVPDATQIRVELGNYLGGVGLQSNQGATAQKSKWKLLEG